VNEKSGNQVAIYLDDNPKPITAYVPPGSFELDTTLLNDGPHQLRVVAEDRTGHRGVRIISFEVRNGPGIAVGGLRENDIVGGKITVLVNAYSGAYDEKWEPSSAETPAPIPTWAWVALIVVVAWAMYYGARQWEPGQEFANTPTYWSPAVQEAEETTQAGRGAELYRTSCASCHQNNGQGVPDVFPPLAGNTVVEARDATEHIEVVLFGKSGGTIDGVKYKSQMPAWADQLSDKEVAAVINHERTSWGNDAPKVTPDEVAKIRRKERT
jgi:mono/diheme cytochrome c family protein